MGDRALAPRLNPTAPLEAWFRRRGWTAFGFQRETWRAFLDGESGLLHSPTGTGKTLAVWGGPLALALADPDPVPSGGPRLVWLTPLRALATDTLQALREPAADLGLCWEIEMRTGDSPARVKARQRERLPELLVTTPESLSLLLARDDAPALFAGLAAVVVDEWHELLSTKRGTQTELALARLRRFAPRHRVWGLSATLGNLEVALRALLGFAADGSPRPGRLVMGEIPKRIEIDALLPPAIDRFPWAGHLTPRLVPAVIAALETTQTAILFTNTRSQAELWFRAILEERPEWSEAIGLHHGSLDRRARSEVETALAAGRLRCVVATSSLDLGVDFAPVDRVLQVGSPKGIARALQRAGRSGHQPGRASRLTCVPTHAFELVEVAAAREGLDQGALEARPPLEAPLDVLAQHIVTVGLGGGFRPSELLAEVRGTHAYRRLGDEDWAWVLDFARGGGPALRAYPEFQRLAVEAPGSPEPSPGDGAAARSSEPVWRHVDEPRWAQRHRMAIGTIVSDTATEVRYLSGGRLGTVEESFASRLRPGDRFLFAGRTLEFVAMREGAAIVRRAPRHASGTVPRWAGGRMPLSSELAERVRRRLDEARAGVYRGEEMAAVRPVLETQAAWSRIPARDELLVERLADEDGHHLFLYPFEGRLVHEGLAALLAWRLGRVRPSTFVYACDDYGLQLVSAEPAPLEEALGRAPGLLDPGGLDEDVPASLNAAEMAKRQFREVARVAGLVVTGYPGARRSHRQVEASSGLLFDVFSRYDPENRLLAQARREVLERQLDRARLEATLARLARARLALVDLERPTPFAFPLLIDFAREKVSAESLARRIERLRMPLERAAARVEGARG